VAYVAVGTGLTFQKIHTSYPSDAAHLFRAILKISIFDFDEFGFWYGTG